MKVQYGFNKPSQFFNSLSASNRRFTQFIIKTEQLAFLQSDMTMVLWMLGFMQLAMNIPRKKIISK